MDWRPSAYRSVSIPQSARRWPSGLRRWNLRLWHRPQSVNILHQRPQYFCHAPRLRDTAARPLGRVAVENFRDVAQAAIGKMVLKRREPRGSLAVRDITVPVDLYVGGDERSHQPRPDGSLVIGAIALGWAARVSATVLGIAWRKAA